MIYTPHELISRREARKRPNPRPAGENADRGDLWICVETAAQWAAIRHETAGLAPPLGGPARRETLVFSENLAPRRESNARRARRYK